MQAAGRAAARAGSAAASSDGGGTARRQRGSGSAAGPGTGGLLGVVGPSQVVLVAVLAILAGGGARLAIPGFGRRLRLRRGAATPPSPRPAPVPANHVASPRLQKRYSDAYEQMNSV